MAPINLLTGMYLLAVVAVTDAASSIDEKTRRRALKPKPTDSALMGSTSSEMSSNLNKHIQSNGHAWEECSSFSHDEVSR